MKADVIIEQASKKPAKLALFQSPPASPLSLYEKIRTGLVGGLAIFLAGWIANLSLGGDGVKMLLVASMGASAVILFAMPHSPVAKPWSLVGGHCISATIGIFCAILIPHTWVAAAVAVGLSIFAMHLARCLHPPGGASALTTVLGGESVKALGFQFLLTPLALNVAVLLLISLLYQRLFLAKPPLPAAQPGAQTKPTERLGIKTEDLRAALAEMDEFVDVDERELNEIYQLAAVHAFRREFGEITAADVMTPEPWSVEFGTELEQVWALMREHRIKALPVIDRGRHVIGIVTQSDFFRHARAEQFRSLGGKLRDLLRPSTTITSDKPEVVGQIMTAPAFTAGTHQHLAELAPLLTERGIHQVPVVDGRNKLAGMITQTDLIAALYRSMTTHLDKAP